MATLLERITLRIVYLMMCTGRKFSRYYIMSIKKRLKAFDAWMQKEDKASSRGMFYSLLILKQPNEVSESLLILGKLSMNVYI